VSLRVDTTSRVITSYGGASLLRETARVVGLQTQVDRCLHLKARQRGLTESEFVLSVAESIALGARCLDDLEVARGDSAQRELRGFSVPAPQTAGTWLRRFTLGHIYQLDKALAAVHRTAFRRLGLDSVTLDFDSTYVFSRSTKRQGVDRTYKLGYALHPLLCFEAKSGVAVHARLRRGRANALTGMSSFLTETLRRVPEGTTMRARLDSGFYSGRLLTQLERSRVTYLCGVPMIPAIAASCTSIPDDHWRSCPDKAEGEVAEFAYRLRDGGPSRRYVVKRIALRDGEQLRFDTGGYRYWVFVTSDHASSAIDLEREHRQKADVESGMRELKSNFGLHGFRTHGFMANWAWLELVCVAHNLCRWTQLLGNLGAGRDGGEVRAKRLRYRFLAVPAIVVRTGRRRVLRLPISYAFYDQFTAALIRLQRLPAPPG
jgi:hypothetical protein